AAPVRESQHDSGAGHRAAATTRFRSPGQLVLLTDARGDAAAVRVTRGEGNAEVTTSDRAAQDAASLAHAAPVRESQHDSGAGHRAGATSLLPLAAGQFVLLADARGD